MAVRHGVSDGVPKYAQPNSDGIADFPVRLFAGRLLRMRPILRQLTLRLSRLAILVAGLLAMAMNIRADVAKDAEPYAPHTPTLIFYLTGASSARDAEAIQVGVQKLKSASVVSVNTNRSYARIRFDSHVVSYHQVAQTLEDAGVTLGKNYNPWLVFMVTGYNQTNNIARVDAILAGKRLNQRIKVKLLNKTKGEFAIHFLPLEYVPNQSALPGFNGGHLHHPISDPPPRGLGLVSSYAADDGDH